MKEGFTYTDWTHQIPVAEAEETAAQLGHRMTSRGGMFYCTNRHCEAFGGITMNKRRKVWGERSIMALGPIVRLQCPVNEVPEEGVLPERRSGQERRRVDRRGGEVDRRGGLVGRRHGPDRRQG